MRDISSCILDFLQKVFLPFILPVLSFLYALHVLYDSGDPFKDGIFDGLFDILVISIITFAIFAGILALFMWVFMPIIISLLFAVDVVACFIMRVLFRR